MKTKIVLIASGLILAGSLYFGGKAIYHNLTKPQVIVTQHNGDIIVKQPQENVVAEFPSDMSEKDMQQTIHDMSHQKVEADQKWGGAIPLSDENVKRLIEVIEINKTNYYSSDVYLQILYRWQKHDFSQIVQDHNIIWELQNGNIGEATGTMPIDEEKQYIENNFKAKKVEY